MVQAIAINTRFHNLSNEQLADAIGQADAALKGAEAEVAALKSEFKTRGLRVVAGGNFTITCLDQIAGRLDISAVKTFLGDAWRQFEVASITTVVRIKAVSRPVIAGVN
jgi:hypothetical protein